MNLFIFMAFKDPKWFLMNALVVIFSICLHEFFHAWTALQFGDTTAASRGHLTLNPMKQMGPVSLGIFLILGFAWGAVPVDQAYLRAKNRHAPAIVALAGPATNFGLFLIGFFFFGFFQTRIWNMVWLETIGETIAELFYLLGGINCFLCFFNLLPIPGLDGWTALTEYKPQMKNLNTEFSKGITIFLIFLLIFMAGDFFDLAFKLVDMAPDIFRAR